VIASQAQALVSSQATNSGAAWPVRRTCRRGTHPCDLLRRGRSGRDDVRRHRIGPASGSGRHSARWRLILSAIHDCARPPGCSCRPAVVIPRAPISFFASQHRAVPGAEGSRAPRPSPPRSSARCAAGLSLARQRGTATRHLSVAVRAHSDGSVARHNARGAVCAGGPMTTTHRLPTVNHRVRHGHQQTP
jgi:hypothetical protein